MERLKHASGASARASSGRGTSIGTRAFQGDKGLHPRIDGFAHPRDKAHLPQDTAGGGGKSQVEHGAGEVDEDGVSEPAKNPEPLEGRHRTPKHIAHKLVVVNEIDTESRGSNLVDQVVLDFKAREELEQCHRGDQQQRAVRGEEKGRMAADE